MQYDPLKHHRRSIRLKDYDYRSPGAYYVTAVTRGRLSFYGEIVNAELSFNAAGQMVERWWLELLNKFPTIELDEYVVMPNHFHGILVITDGDQGQGAHPGAPQPEHHDDAADGVAADGVGADLRVRPGPDGDARPSLPTIMQWFKTMTTNEYIRGVKTLGWPAFPGQLWQRDYYEHVIRNPAELDAIRLYIANNLTQWALDEENPARSDAGRAHG
jgi:putative transposase